MEGARLTPVVRSQRVKRQAADLGFDACGVAEAGPIDPHDHLGEWLAAGYHADMNWMETTKEIRRDPRLHLPGAQSVVVVARNYFAERPQPPRGSGRVSRYAWGRDYHRALRMPLQRLARFVDSMEVDSKCYCCIDSGPVLEKAWAARAGVGWIGKNSLVLRTDLGSWFFLGAIVTTTKLAPDLPMPDQCGTCRTCIDACPTSALVAPRILDARRCISYHTIENRGEIPKALQSAFGDWVFGCDICQEVCPYNHTKRMGGAVGPSSEKDFHPKPGHANPDLAGLLHMDEGTFRAEFAGTPILRAKHAGMRRNASITFRNKNK
jgi:epoxyqueuosine reductase